MQGYILDRKEPLYGLADEIIRLTPIPVQYIGQALGCDAQKAIEEYAVWGGIPRYWELRADYKDNETAIEKLLLDNKGFLADEPIRLLRDDMRDTVQASTLLSIIGNGANRLSEIAGRVGKEATQITEPLGKLRELGYIRREVPFGEDEKKAKRDIPYQRQPAGVQLQVCRTLQIHFGTGTDRNRAIHHKNTILRVCRGVLGAPLPPICKR